MSENETAAEDKFGPVLHQIYDGDETVRVRYNPTAQTVRVDVDLTEPKGDMASYGLDPDDGEPLDAQAHRWDMPAVMALELAKNLAAAAGAAIATAATQPASDEREAGK